MTDDRSTDSAADTAEFASQLVAGASIVAACATAGASAMVLYFFVLPLAGLLDLGLHLAGRARGARARTGVLSWAFYISGLHNPPLWICGPLARLSALCGRHSHAVMLLNAAVAIAVWPIALVHAGSVETNGVDAAVGAAAGLGASAAAFAQGWAMWRRRADERRTEGDPAHLAQAAEESARREREEAEAIRRMFRS